MDLRDLRFGVEIETVRRTRRSVAEGIQSIVGGVVEHVGSPSCYDPYHVIAEDGRIWKVVADASLSNVAKQLQAEIVSPILNYDDLPTLQKIVRQVRTGSRAKISKQCGIHVHIDAANFSPKALVKITIDIQADSDEGFSDDLVRTVSENSNALNISQHGFEDK